MQSPDMQKNSSAWLDFIQKNLSNTGHIFTHDAHSEPITFTWHLYNVASPACTQAVKDLSAIFIETYTRQEVEFARNCPQKVSTDMFLKDVAHLFANGIEQVDWHAVERGVRDQMVDFFTTKDFAQWANPHEITIFVVAHGKDGQQLGTIQFCVTPEFDYGTVRVGMAGVLQQAQHRGIEKLLMSSLFKLLPTTVRIFLHNRPTNERAIRMYGEWGFVPFAGMLQDWSDFEYLATHNDTLQKTALLMS